MSLTVNKIIKPNKVGNSTTLRIITNKNRCVRSRKTQGRYCHWLQIGKTKYGRSYRTHHATPAIHVRSMFSKTFIHISFILLAVLWYRYNGLWLCDPSSHMLHLMCLFENGKSWQNVIFRSIEHVATRQNIHRPRNGFNKKLLKVFFPI